MTEERFESRTTHVVTNSTGTDTIEVSVTVRDQSSDSVNRQIKALGAAMLQGAE